tara:strand:- start:504 stop:839 length:336 start_codon:yes stop_codon:yes gene_type:complete
MAAHINLFSSNDSRVDTTRTVGEKEKAKEKTLVIVKWKDVLSDDGWTLAKDVECPVLYSVGWLVSDDKETLKIASTLDPDDFSGEAKDEAKPVPYGITAFPRGCVMSVKSI